MLLYLRILNTELNWQNKHVFIGLISENLKQSKINTEFSEKFDGNG